MGPTEMESLSGAALFWSWLHMPSTQLLWTINMDQDKRQFIASASASARMVGHPYPDMAACEAALESSYGRSDLAVRYKNLFGMKQHRHPVYDTVSLPTREYIDGKWEETTGEFISYPDWQDCFADRL